MLEEAGGVEAEAGSPRCRGRFSAVRLAKCSVEPSHVWMQQITAWADVRDSKRNMRLDAETFGALTFAEP